MVEGSNTQFSAGAVITLIIICLVQFERGDEIDAELLVLGRERIKIFGENWMYNRVLICLFRTFLDKSRQIEILTRKCVYK